MADGVRNSRALSAYEAATYSLALVLGLIALWRFPVPDWQTVLFLGALCILADFFAIQIPDMGAVSLSFSMILAAALLGGPSTAALVAAIGSISVVDIQAGRPASRMIFNSAQYVASAVLAGLVLIVMHIPPLQLAAGAPSEGIRWLSAAVASTLALVATNAMLVGGVIAISMRVPFRKVLSQYFGWHAVNMIALALLGLVLAELLYVAGIPGTLLIVVPFSIARENFEVFQRQSGAYRETVRSLVAAIEAKDPYTRGHSERVAWYARAIASELGLSPVELQRIEWAALLHDVGKVALDATTLTKATALSPDEYELVREHPRRAVEILQDIGFLEDAIPLIASHHERIDGDGYPAGLSGTDIPLGARILSVADSFDAMTSDRSYRRALTYSEAKQQLLEGAGLQFDDRCVSGFLATVHEEHVVRLLASSERLEGWIA